MLPLDGGSPSSHCFQGHYSPMTGPSESFSYSSIIHSSLHSPRTSAPVNLKCPPTCPPRAALCSTNTKYLWHSTYPEFSPCVFTRRPATPESPWLSVNNVSSLGSPSRAGLQLFIFKICS